MRYFTNRRLIGGIPPCRAPPDILPCLGTIDEKRPNDKPEAKVNVITARSITVIEEAPVTASDVGIVLLRLT